ncbi:hypothetical protein IAT38_003331 [Cryptococcus sp. DSM 104549]
MPSERVVRTSHIASFTLIIIASLIAVGLSGYLVGKYNSDGYPPVHTHAYRDRIRIVLVASVWSAAFGLILTGGFHALGRKPAFGLLTHLVPVAIGFILFLIGTSALTALTTKIDCGKSGDTFSHCRTVKGLVVISWIDTIFLFITLIFLVILCFIARGGYGAHRSTLYLD